MSENIVTLTNKKNNEIEFEMEVEGLTVKPSDIRFIIETSDMDYAFKCTQKGKVCVVKIPPLPQLEKTMYPFRIETVIDGYHFTPMNGQVNVTGSFDVYTTEPKNKTVAPAVKKAVPKKEEKPAAKPAVKKAAPKKDDTKISDLAKKVTGKKAEKPAAKKPAPKTPVKEDTEKVDELWDMNKIKKNSEEYKKASQKKNRKDAASGKVAKKQTTVKEETIDLATVEADQIVKDAIAGIKDIKMSPAPVAKVDTKPFFKKVNEGDNKAVVTEEKKIVKQPEESEKDKAIHAILESKEEKKPAAPTVSFKKGKKVKA